MRRLYVTFAVVFWFWASPTWATCTGSSPNWTSTPDYASVSACVASASRNDTLNVTSGDGTEAWPSVLSITKGIKLIGPGRDNLEISRSGNIIAIAPDAMAIANEEIIRIKGFTFKGNDMALTSITATGSSSSSAKPFKALVIEQNRFRDMSPVTSGSGVVNTRGQVRGVIADNIFDRVNVVFKVMGNDTKDEWTNGIFPFSYGNGDNFYFEDNTILWTTTGSAGGAPGWTETGQGGRMAVRYNTWNMANSVGQSELWDMHGFQNFPGAPRYETTGQSGTMVSEYYGNTITAKAGYRWVAFRGSYGLMFNNIVTGISGSSMEMMQYDGGCNRNVDASWPLPNGEINNTYGFNNTMNGSTVNLSLHVSTMVGNTCPPVENSTFWNHNASCTSSACTSGIGRGTTTPEGTCSIGTGYWVASTPTPTVDPSVVQNGAFYKCTSPNTWELYYKPYIYPHPLRSGRGTNIKSPVPPTRLTIS